MPDPELESKVAGFVRTYIHALRNGNDAEQQEALGLVCSGLEYLLESLLEGSDGWNGWVDGILPMTDFPGGVSIDSELSLTIRGKALWGKEARGPFWIEPFLATLRISSTSEVLDSYHINFADAARHLGAFTYGKHIRRADWYFPAEWRYTFSK